MFNFMLIYYGFLAMLTQLVAFRELSVLFYGNELFLGTFLSSWLFWIGMGSFLARRLTQNREAVAAYLSYAFLAESLLFPGMILLIRASKGYFAFGEFIGPLTTVLYTFSIMGLLCFVIGAQFSLACAAAPGRIRKERVLGRVYLCESLGAVIGGVLFTYVLIGYAPTFAIALSLSLGSIFVSLIPLIKKTNFGNMILIAGSLAVLSICLVMEPAVNRFEWNRYRFIKQKEARNDTLSLVSMGSIKSLFKDGMLSASFPDQQGYEPAAHWPLLASATPDRILIIGDTSLGLIKEALKYKPERIDYVVSDGSFIDLARPYLEDEDLRALEDPATQIHYADSRIFIRDNENRYDVVIINMQEVPNLKANRYYTKEFYGQIRSALKPGGIFASSIASSENYLSMNTRMFNASVFITLKSVFNTVEVIPGDTITFLSSPSAIDMRKATILERFNAGNISNQYVIPSYIEYKLEVKRRAELKKVLEETPGVEINKDFRPTTCYYFANFWLNKFASPLGYLVSGILFMALAVLILNKRVLSRFSAVRKEAALIFALGFIGIVLEIVLLLGYQIISGYVYWQLGVLFASFMAGLFLGSLLANRLKHDSARRHFICLMILSLIITALSLCAGYLLPRLIYLTTTQNIIIFAALLSLIGTVVGGSFVIAGFLVSEEEPMRKAGGLYAADLWGAGLGAMLSTNFIVPVFGILGALNLSALAGLAALGLFLILARRTGL